MAPQRHQKAPKRIQYGAQSGSMAIRTPPPRKLHGGIPTPRECADGHPRGPKWCPGYQKWSQWGANGHSDPPRKNHGDIPPPTPPGMCGRPSKRPKIVPKGTKKCANGGPMAIPTPLVNFTGAFRPPRGCAEGRSPRKNYTPAEHQYI